MHAPAMEERVIAWSRGRRLRIVVMDVPGDLDRLLRAVGERARRVDDRFRLADDVSCLFDRCVRVQTRVEGGTEEVVLQVG